MLIWAQACTWEAFAGQVSQWPEDITHKWGTAGTGLSDGGEDFLHVTLKILLQKEKKTYKYTEEKTNNCLDKGKSPSESVSTYLVDLHIVPFL